MSHSPTVEQLADAIKHDREARDAIIEALRDHGDVYTRRQVMAAAATTGAVGVLSALGIDSAKASHGTGEIGEQGNPLDKVWTTSIGGDGDTVSFDDPIDVETLSSDYHYAGAHSGADPDARLDAALTAAEDGDRIYLENDNYSETHTINTAVTLIGTHTQASNANQTQFSGDLTVDAAVRITSVRFNANTVTINAAASRVQDARLDGSLNVNAGFCVFTGLAGNGTITFSNGNSGSIVDSSSNISVTDNDGGNTVGDIA